MTNNTSHFEFKIKDLTPFIYPCLNKSTVRNNVPPFLHRLSMIDKDDFATWFRQFWTITGASTRNHPAPFPFELAYRLVRMFSFWDDTVLDPFCGTGTTMLAAMKCGRNSIGVEIDEDYCRMALQRLRNEGHVLLRDADIVFSRTGDNGNGLVAQEEPATYGKKKSRSKTTGTGKSGARKRNK